MSGGAAPAPAWRFRLALAAIACLALALRLAGLAEQSLWFDEALEAARAAADLATLLHGRPIDQDPFGWPLLLRAWLILGEVGPAADALPAGMAARDWWLRAPSALVGAAALLPAGAWAGRRFGWGTGLLAALLMACAPVQLLYGQELNQYAAMLFLAVLLLVAWDLLVRRRRPVDWWRFGLLSIVALLTHYGLAFPLAAMGLYLAWRVRRAGRPAERRALAAYLAACATTVALLMVLGLASRLELAHRQPRFGGTGLVKELDYLLDIGWRELLVFQFLPFSGGAAQAAVAVLALIAGLGALVLWRQGPAGRRLIGVVLGGSLLLTYPADGLGAYPLGFRWALYAAVPFTCALAAGLLWLAGEVPALRAAAIGATLLLFLGFAPRMDAANPHLALPREAMRPLVATLAARHRPADRVYVSPRAAPAFAYYAPPRLEIIWGGSDPARELASLADARAPRDGALWVVLARLWPREEATVEAALGARGWRLRERWAWPGVLALRFEAPGAGSGD